VQLDRFILETLIGEGGTARVYRARDTTDQTFVAIKLYRHELMNQAELLQRFRSEVRLLSTFDHPNVLPCLDHGEEPGSGLPWFATRLCKGSLAGLIYQGGPIPLRTMGRYCVEVLDGLAELHARNIVHRDVKPDNILLDDDDVAILGDFGIALNPRTRPTQVDAVMGTPHFMAPEQFDDPREATPSADLFALGCTLYTGITGKSSMVLLMTPRRSDALDLLVDERMRAIVDQATSPEPEDRFASARAMADALADLL